MAQHLSELAQLLCCTPWYPVGPLTSRAAHVAPVWHDLAGSTGGRLGAAHLAGAHVAEGCSSTRRVRLHELSHCHTWAAQRGNTAVCRSISISKCPCDGSPPSFSGQHFLLTKSYWSESREHGGQTQSGDLRSGGSASCLERYSGRHRLAGLDAQPLQVQSTHWHVLSGSTWQAEALFCIWRRPCAREERAPPHALTGCAALGHSAIHVAVRPCRAAGLQPAWILDDGRVDKACKGGQAVVESLECGAQESFHGGSRSHVS